jgi:long-subunit acyl-CoA synthetase (AMP-forming)
MPVSLCDAFQTTAAIDPSAVALRTPDDAVTITWGQYRDRVKAIASGLAALGVGANDTVALMLTNRPEFHLADTAALHLGAIPFSIYNTSSPEQVRYILGNAESKVVITERAFLKTLRTSGAELGHIVCVDGHESETLSLNDVEHMQVPGFDFERTWRSVSADDVATLIYTSGTTGDPKAVEITHANLLAQLEAFDRILDIRFGDRTICYLPSAHIADRLASHYTQITHGTQITEVADMSTVADVVRDVQPTIFVAVPRIWDKMKFAVQNAIDEMPQRTRRRLAMRAVALSRRRVQLGQQGRQPGALAELLWRAADTIILRKIRSQLGFGQLRWAMSGAAAVSTDTVEFFLALGIPICEIWGMSETAGAATSNPPQRIKIGTVGPALPGMELKLADDGEVLLRGPVIMRGYRNDPARTAEVLDDDGWLATGDVGTLDPDGYLTVVDRKKELIINAAGKNMSPANIENAILTACPVAATAVAIGNDRPYNVALIVLDVATAGAVATQAGRPSSDVASLADDPAVRAAVEQGVAEGNSRLSRVEQIKRFRILPTVWSPGGDELTPTMKLRRRVVEAKYAADIVRLYA